MERYDLLQKMLSDALKTKTHKIDIFKGGSTLENNRS